MDQLVKYRCFFKYKYYNVYCDIIKTKHTIVHSENVFLEDGRVSEVLAASWTVKLLHSTVNLAVPRQHRVPREPLVADATFERSLSAVDHLVVAQSVVATEGLLTHGTLVRLFAGVAAPVRRQTARSRETLLADVALKRLLAAMRLDVDAQMFRPTESLPTQETFMRLHTGVDHAVPFEVRDASEAFIADDTLERSVRRVIADVKFQRTARLVAFPTFRALVLRFVRVDKRGFRRSRTVLFGRNQILSLFGVCRLVS